MEIPEQKLNPPDPELGLRRIVSYWITYKWDDGETGELDFRSKDIERELDEIESDENYDYYLQEDLKYGNPDRDDY